MSGVIEEEPHEATNPGEKDKTELDDGKTLESSDVAGHTSVIGVSELARRHSDDAGRPYPKITSSQAHAISSPILEKKPKIGECWYPIDHKWWTHFNHFGYLSKQDIEMINLDSNIDVTNLPDREIPPLLDNSELQSKVEGKEHELKRGMVEDQDFIWVHEELFNYFEEWFGISENTPNFPRYVIGVGILLEEQIEMYPFFVKTCLCDEKGNPDYNDTKLWQMSRQDTPKNLQEKAKKYYNKLDNTPLDSTRDLRLWRKSTDDEKKRMKKYALKSKHAKNKHELTPPANDNAAPIVNNNGGEGGAAGSTEEGQWQAFGNDNDEALPSYDQALDAPDNPPPKDNDNDNNNNNNGDQQDDPDAVVDDAVDEFIEINHDDDDNKDNNNNDNAEIDDSQFEWMILGDGELSFKFDNFAIGLDMISEPYWMIEIQNDWEEWKRDLNWRMLLVPGCAVDCLDTQLRVPKWYPAHIIEIDEENDTVHINYDNYSAKWNVWLDRDHERIAPIHTETTAFTSNNDGWNSGGGGLYNNWSSGGGWGGSSGWGGGGWRSGNSWYSDTKGQPTPSSGCVGLRNLGNTCFMNSTIQCLAHCPNMVDYFLNDSYVPDVNRDNPLGWSGKVADAWSAMLKRYWSDEYTVISPSKIKSTVTEVQPRFSGYQQHDSSEFLQFLLDGLHEDLNRIKKKPATEKVESDGREDKIVAQESWVTHKLRNDSIMVDLLQGQLKSRVECPDCGRVSVTFDPFMFLSVPIPSKRKETVKLITLVRSNVINFKVTPTNNGTENIISNENNPSLVVPTTYGVSIPSLSSIYELKVKLGEMTGISANRLVLVDMFHNRIYNWYQDYGSVDEIRDSDTVYAYEVPTNEDIIESQIFGDLNKLPPNSDDDNTIGSSNKNKLRFLLCCLQHKYLKENRNSWSSKQWRSEDIGIPMVMRLPINRPINCKVLNEYCKKMIEPYVINENVENFTISTVDIDREKHKAGVAYKRSNNDNNDRYNSGNNNNNDYNPLNDIYDNNPGEGGNDPNAKSLDSDDEHDEHSSARDPNQHEPPGVNGYRGYNDDDDRDEGDLHGISNMFGDDDDEREEAARIEQATQASLATHEEENNNNDNVDNTDNQEEPVDAPIDAPVDAPVDTTTEDNEQPPGYDEVSNPTNATDAGVDNTNNGDNVNNEDNGNNEESPYDNLGPYSFIVLNKHGNSCGLCGMMSTCDGCDLLSEENILIPDSQWDSINIGCEWRLNGLNCFNHKLFEEPINDETVPEKRTTSYGRHSSLWESQDPIELSKCIDELTTEETLAESEAWYCRNCKEHKCAKKKFDLWKVPDICIIHLKRFTQNQYSRDKNSTPVVYPIKGLDLSNWIVNDSEKGQLYDLFAVSIHSGGLGGGHYIANGKNVRTGEWFEFDDSNVSSIDNDDGVYTSEAYVLFYKKRNMSNAGRYSRNINVENNENNNDNNNENENNNNNNNNNNNENNENSNVEETMDSAATGVTGTEITETTQNDEMIAPV